ncbi:ABC transporter substrate-binding protein [Oryzomicrobium sp.]|uniref:ABC transporter substrate-binding protein n=1 Tax=Oryzomicrobium sp. TaxID=1911578 RepID=UPI002FE2136F
MTSSCLPPADRERRIILQRLAGVGLAAAATAVGCPLPALAAEGPEKPRLTIAVGGKGLFYYLPLTIAERLGYFKDEGLNVEIVDFPGGAKALQALMGGSADLVSGSFEHTISLQAKGQWIKAVALEGRMAGIVLAMRKDRAARYKSPKDLKGLKIGVTAPGSSTNMFVNTLLAKEGLKPDAVSIIGVGAGAGAIAAIRRGDVDAVANLDPVISTLEVIGDVVPVVDTRTEAGMQYVYGGAYAAGCIYATNDFIIHNPRTTQAVVNALVRADRWLQKATPEQVVATVPPEFYGSDRGLYKVSLMKNTAAFSPDGTISPDGVQNVYKVLRSFDPTVAGARIDLSKTYDNSFALQAQRKYK